MKHATLMAGLGCGEATGKGVLEPILDAALFLLKTFTRPSVLLLVQKLSGCIMLYPLCEGWFYCDIACAILLNNMNASKKNRFFKRLDADSL